MVRAVLNLFRAATRFAVPIILIYVAAATLPVSATEEQRCSFEVARTILAKNDSVVIGRGDFGLHDRTVVDFQVQWLSRGDEAASEADTVSLKFDDEGSLVGAIEVYPWFATGTLAKPAGVVARFRAKNSDDPGVHAVAFVDNGRVRVDLRLSECAIDRVATNEPSDAREEAPPDVAVETNTPTQLPPDVEPANLALELFLRTAADQGRCKIIWPQTKLIEMAVSTGAYTKAFLESALMVSIQGKMALPYVQAPPAERAVWDTVIGIVSQIHAAQLNCAVTTAELREGWNLLAQRLGSGPVYIWAFDDYGQYRQSDIETLGIADYLIQECWQTGQQRTYSSAFESIGDAYLREMRKNRFYRADFSNGQLAGRDRYGTMTDKACADSVDDLTILGVPLLD